MSKLTPTTPPTQTGGSAEPSDNKPIHQDGFHLGEVDMGYEWGRIPFSILSYLSAPGIERQQEVIGMSDR